jgi:nucleoside-diphosphate-sugar epimerase
MTEVPDSMPADAVILLTGATGAVGNELLRQLAGKSHVLVLTRRPPGAQELPTPLSAADCGAVIGDLRDPDLPLILRKKAPSDVTHVIHAAANVSWNSSRSAAFEVNADGTRRLLEYAAGLGKLAQFCLISTAYVCGTRTGYITEDDPLPATYKNAYEESKAAAETVTAQLMGSSLTIRPSIILGRSDSGEIARFRTLYPLLSAWNRGGLPMIVGSDDARVDIVPVDWVARSVIALLSAGAVGPFHLVAGQKSGSLADLANAMAVALNAVRLHDGKTQLPRPAQVDPETYNRMHSPLIDRTARARHRMLLHAFDQYRPYFSTPATFANIRIRRALGEHYLAPPPLVEFIAAAVWYWWRRKGALERDGSMQP